MTDELKHKGLYSALAAAQAEMGRALKDSTNPAFKSKYADLASVMAACMPALSKHGIAVLQPAFDDDVGRYVKTIFVHGETGETVECRVPLIISKNDMQGYGSAVTYARRYGLMGMAGIAPEDDDGNAATTHDVAPKPSKNDAARKAFAAMQADLPRIDTAAELEAWWKTPDIQAARNVLPDDWYQDILEMVKTRKAELVKASAGDSQHPFAGG